MLLDLDLINIAVESELTLFSFRLNDYSKLFSLFFNLKFSCVCTKSITTSVHGLALFPSQRRTL